MGGEVGNGGGGYYHDDIGGPTSLSLWPETFLSGGRFYY